MTAQRRFSHEKLVRDKTVERLKKRGASTIKTRTLSDIEYVEELGKKLIEESRETYEAPTLAERLSELADLLEIIHALADASGSSIKEIEHLRKDKVATRGGFDTRTYCEYVEVDADHELAKYYKESGYPELSIK